MTEQQKMLSRILNQVADELNISQTMYEKAVKSYQVVGNWIANMEGDYSFHCFPQGSFSLGTVVKPFSDDDDGYDIDLVCKIDEAIFWSEKNIKQSVGNRIKENGTYKNDLLDEEGKRCWTLQYEGFHMDILPCAPQHLARTPIRLTHKNDDGSYSPRYSNPEDYKTWFINRMRVIFDEQIREGVYAHADIANVPLYSTRTPLQKVVQLLKRHRDIMFAKDDCNAPLSIIITTLAAKSYDNEINLYDAIVNITNRMSANIQKDSNGYMIMNPVMPLENFAEKWNQSPEKAAAFFRWLNKAKRDMIENPLSFVGLDEMSKPLNEAFGERITKRSLNAIGQQYLNERQNSNLYVSGLVGGLTVGKANEKSRIVGGHTFFGE